jgi:hypothetical protein
VAEMLDERPSEEPDDRQRLPHGQNLTFQCEETQGEAGAKWDDNSNTIIVRWGPGGSYPTEHALIHELVHKCGFNKYLLKPPHGEGWYSRDEIEAQTARVAGACY